MKCSGEVDKNKFFSFTVLGRFAPQLITTYGY